ncbi:MAG: tripartite tricarboxylate transporter permease, partial [bacterium]
MISEAVALVFQPSILLVMLVSALYGLFVGSIPGLTATMAVALMVPFTFYMDPIPALAAIVTLEATAIFAGDIPGALVRIPGTPSSAAYTDDAYALTLRGMAHSVLGVCLIFSVLGGLFGAVVLMLAAPALAAFALNFTSYEYFWLALLGLSSAALVAKGSPVKGALSLGIGLFLSTIGLDPVDGYARFSFGQSDLIGGISFIPAMIGL